MERTINIGDKELKVKSTLFTIIDYKNTFGTDLFQDITQIGENKKSAEITSVLRVLFQIIYILNKPYSKQTFDDFLNGFDFAIINDPKSLEEITNVIGELLGTITNAPKGDVVPNP